MFFYFNAPKMIKFDLKYMYLSARSFDIVVLLRLLKIVAKYTSQNLRFYLLKKTRSATINIFEKKIFSV